ncbi:hypothetical protein F4801DRAFT_60103 [Xylaria longipes]|nr:hypothetical protein F4801DRAFT_60103 [Xylaria longipes]
MRKEEPVTNKNLNPPHQKNPGHYALVFRRDVDASLFPDRLGVYLTHLPDSCDTRTPRGNRPSRTEQVNDSARFYPYGEESPVNESPGEGEEAEHAPDPPANGYYPSHVEVSDWGGFWYAASDRSMANEPTRDKARKVRLRGGGGNLRR